MIVTNSDEYQRWLHCKCDACKRLDAIAHNQLCWTELFDATKHECPNYSEAIYKDAPADTQLNMFGVQS
jgi:hypothetical protein